MTRALSVCGVRYKACCHLRSTGMSKAPRFRPRCPFFARACVEKRPRRADRLSRQLGDGERASAPWAHGRYSVCPRVRNSSFHRAAILLSCGVGTQLALRPLQLEAGSRRGTSARKAYPPSSFRGLASRRWRQLRYTEGLASLATEPFERVAKPREQSDESATGSFQ